MDASITAQALSAALKRPHPPLVIDVRRAQAFLDAAGMLCGARGMILCDGLFRRCREQ